MQINLQTCNFVSSNRIFIFHHIYIFQIWRKLLLCLQEKAIKWTENGSVDGLTTNGVLLNHPQGDFWGGDATYGTWREVSVNGKLFTLRPVRDSDVRGIPVSSVTFFMSVFVFIK